MQARQAVALAQQGISYIPIPSRGPIFSCRIFPSVSTQLMGHLSNGTEGCAHGLNLHSHHGEGKLLLMGRQHTGKRVLWPCPGIKTIHIQPHITSLAAPLPAQPRCAHGSCWSRQSCCASLCWTCSPGVGHSPKHLLKKKMQAVDRAVLVQGQEDTSRPSVGPTGTCQCRTNPVHPSVEAVFHVPYRDPCRPLSFSSFSSGSLQRQITHLLFPTYYFP